MGNAEASVADEIDAILKEQGDWMTYQQIFEVLTRRGRARCASVKNIIAAASQHRAGKKPALGCVLRNYAPPTTPLPLGLDQWQHEEPVKKTRTRTRPRRVQDCK